MPKRTNPTSLRIGTQYLWKHEVQTYTRKNSHVIFFSLFVTQKFSFMFRVLQDNNLSYLEDLNLKTFRDKHITNLKVYSHPSAILSKPKIFNSNLTIYKFSTTFSSAQLILQHSLFLFKSNRWAAKKLVLFLVLSLQNIFDFKKIVHTKFGPRAVNFKGFKLEFSGRFESSTTQMAKRIVEVSGRLPLTTLNHYVEYASSPLFFKLGSCNLKIWLFYA